MTHRLPVVAAVTADFIRSRSYSPNDRLKIDTGLRSAIKLTVKQYRGDIHTGPSFRVTVGDEFQWVIRTPARAFEMLLYLRALVTAIDVDPMPMFRASIGIGEIAVDGRRSSYEKDGPAFVRSRAGLEALTDARSTAVERITAIVTADLKTNRTSDVILTLLDSFQIDWTRAQWEAIRWAVVGMSRTEISERVDVAHQNVSKRLIAARWETFRVGLESVGTLMSSAHPVQDARNNRTPKRVRTRLV